MHQKFEQEGTDLTSGRREFQMVGVATWNHLVLKESLCGRARRKSE